MAAHHEPTPVHEVQDMADWVFFEFLFGEPKSWHLPNIFGFQITKFMILELIAAALILLIYIPLSRRVRSGALPKGRWWNCFESLLTFVRNEIAKPNLEPPAGHHDHGHDEHGHAEHGHAEHHAPVSESDRYVPYLWTVFLFVL